MSKSRSKVEEQKGPIDPNPMTMNQQSHRQNVKEAIEQNALRRSGQTMTLHMPKTSRK
jgi:hypothetical protein